MGTMLKVGVGIRIKLIDQLAEVRFDCGVSRRIIRRQQPVIEPHDALIGFETKRRIGFKAGAALKAGAKGLPQAIDKLSGGRLLAAVH